MNFTYRNVLWKDNATNSIVPTNSRPFANNDPNLESQGRTPGKPNPIKHWRKQLKPYYPTVSSKQVSIDMINAPTSVVHTGSTTYDCNTSNAQLLKENILLLNECNGIKVLNDNNEIKCIGGSYNIRRSASTNLKPNYFRNYSKYLQAKCRTHEQNSTLGQKNNDGTYQGAKCTTVNMKCNKPIIYKPSNTSFMEQGSVSASTNIMKKRYQTIVKNSASLKATYGNSYISQVLDTTQTPYSIRYIKNNQLLEKCNKSGCTD